MKKIFLLALFIAMYSFGFVGCSDDDEVVVPPAPPTPTEETPVIKLVSSVVEAEAAGGEFTVNYTIENPSKEGKLTLTPSETPEWLTAAVAGDKISFTVASNQTPEPRTFEFTATYPKAADVRLTVKQAAASKQIEVRLTDTSEMSAHFNITPKDKAMRYVVMTFYSDMVNMFPNDKDLVANDKRYFEQMAADLEVPFGELMESNSEVGDQELYPVEGLVPGRKYTTYVYGVSLPDYTQLTEVTRVEYETLPVKKETIKFDIQAKAEGVTVDLNIHPINYNGMYSYDVIEFPDDATDEQITTRIEEEWYQAVALYLMFDETPESIVNMMSTSGECVWATDKLANRTYVAYAYAVDEKTAFMKSDVQFVRVKTGDVPPSDNVIDIRISDITPYTAKVMIMPSNEDPFAMVGVSTEQVKDLTDEELPKFLMSMVNDPVTGPFEADMRGLSPETEYRVYAFGYYSGAITTQLYEARFSTAKAVPSDTRAALNYGKFYDSMAVAELDPGYKNMAKEGAVFIPVDFIFDEGTTFYSSFMTQKEADSLSDEQIITMVIDRFGPTKVTPPYSILRAPYDMPVVGIAFAVDQEGRFTKLFRGAPVTATVDKASDPKEFVEKYPNPGTQAAQQPVSMSAPVFEKSIMAEDAKVTNFKKELAFDKRRTAYTEAMKVKAAGKRIR